MLRDYQQGNNDTVRAALAGGSRVSLCVQAPTGSGKSVMAADLLADPVPQLFATHRRILFDQLSATLTRWGVPHGLRAAGHVPNPAARVQLCMIQTDFARSLKGEGNARWALHEGCQRIHLDEIHAVKGTMAKALIKAYPHAHLIGWTATPRGVGGICDRLIVAATVPELIQAGHLVKPIVFTPDGPSVRRLSNLRRNTGGDFSPKDLDKIMQPKVILGRVAHWLPRTNLADAPAVLFAPGVRQSLWFAQGLTAAGIPAAHIDAKTIWIGDQSYDSTPKNRAMVFAALEHGNIKVLCNRFVLREGWDMPAVGHVILATAFGARTSFVQACGRGLRPFNGKRFCTYQDHGANFWRFPELESAEPWDMDEDEKDYMRKREDGMTDGSIAEPICCPQCRCLRTRGMTCPNCGHRSELGAREVLQLRGRLVRKEGKLFLPEAPSSRTPSTPEEKLWRSAFWGARKSGRSMRQAYSWACRLNGWRKLPLTLPLMPRGGASDPAWDERASNVDFKALI